VLNPSYFGFLIKGNWGVVTTASFPVDEKESKIKYAGMFIATESCEMMSIGRGTSCTIAEFVFIQKAIWNLSSNSSPLKQLLP